MWWDGVSGYLQWESRRWPHEHAQLGYMEPQSLLRESTPQALAHGAWDYLGDMGFLPPSDSQGYRLLVSVLVHYKEASFRDAMCERLQRQL